MQKRMGIGQIVFISGIVISLAFTGCASRTEVLQFQTDLQDIKLVLSSMQSENRDITAKLNSLQALMQHSEESSNRNKADILAEMSSLRERNQYLMNMLNDTGDLMSKLVHKMKERAASQSQLIDSLLISGSQTADSLEARPRRDLAPQELYDSAYLDLSEQNYELAESGFAQYLKVFKGSDYADNAQYWLGEISYAQKDFEKAFTRFRLVTTDYPAGDKVPDALLKMGFCLFNLNRKAEARRVLNRVVDEYPNSTVRSLAKAKLEEI